MEECRNVKSLADEELTVHEQYLQEEGRSRATIEKCLQDVRKLRDYICERDSRGLDRELVSKYRQYLNENYKIADMNSMLVVVNSFFSYLGYGERRAELFRTQRVQLSEKEKELAEKGYERLVHMAERRGNIRISILLQMIGSMGVRISEL